MGNCAKGASKDQVNSPEVKKDSTAPNGYKSPRESVQNVLFHRATQKGAQNLLNRWANDEANGLPAGPEVDTPALHWLNWAVKEMWPYTNEAVLDVIKTLLEPALQAAVPGPLKGLHFSEFSIGETSPVLGPLCVYTKNKQRHPGIEIDVGVDWQCDANIALEVPHLVSIGIRKLRVSGEVSVVLRPLMKQLPIVGGIQLFMISPPEIDWDFTGAANVVDFPVISQTMRKVVMEVVSSLIVLPNRLFIHWVWGREAEIDITAMQYPMPEGLLRLCVVEAKDVEGKDWNAVGKATSDPYAIVHVGSRSHRTCTKNKTTAPNWGDSGWGDFFIFNPRQIINIEVYDHDLMPGADDLIGRMDKVRLQEIIGKHDSWWPIYAASNGGSPKKNGVGTKQTGMVRIHTEVFDFCSNSHLVKNPPAKKGEKAKSVALLTVQLRCLRGLVKEKSNGARIRILIGDFMELSIAATYSEVYQDLIYDFDAQVIDPAAQRMAEFMSTEQQLPLDKIVEISGLNKDSLDLILKQRPSFTTRWNQGFNILLEDVKYAEIQLQLILPGVKEEKANRIELAKPVKVAEILDKENMTWDGVVTLNSTNPKPINENDLKEAQAYARRLQGPFDLDIQFQLWGLQMPKSTGANSKKTPATS